MIKEKKPKKGFMDCYTKTYDTSKGFGSPDEWRKAFEQRMNFGVVISIETKEQKKDILQPLYDAKDFFELRKAYRELMFIYHPDVAGDTEDNKVISQLLNDTYFLLKSKL